MLEAIKEKLRAAGLTVYDFAEKSGHARPPMWWSMIAA